MGESPIRSIRSFSTMMYGHRSIDSVAVLAQEPFAPPLPFRLGPWRSSSLFWGSLRLPWSGCWAFSVRRTQLQCHETSCTEAGLCKVEKRRRSRRFKRRQSRHLQRRRQSPTSERVTDLRADGVADFIDLSADGVATFSAADRFADVNASHRSKRRRGRQLLRLQVTDLSADRVAAPLTESPT